MKKVPWMLLALLWLPQLAVAEAAEMEGMAVPASVVVEGRRLQLNGAGVRKKSIFKIKVYLASLYLESPCAETAQILASDSVRRLELHLMHDASKSRLRGELLAGLESGSEADEPALKVRLDELLASLPDQKQGQTIVFTYVPGKGTTLVAGSWKATVAGKDFADALLRSWLGEAPLDEGLKAQLLGRH